MDGLMSKPFVRQRVSLSGLEASDLDEILAGTARCRNALRGARLLVTGGTGWFGTWLLESLVAIDRDASLGLRIVATSRDPRAFRGRHPALYAADAIEWIEADVRESMDDFQGPFTHVIHAATESSPKSKVESAQGTFDTIVGGTSNVLRLAAAQPGAKVLLVSSGAVYGRQLEGLERMSETDQGSPDFLDATGTYAEGKRAAEHLGAIWHASHGLHVTIARCFAFVGPHMPLDAHFAIGNFIRDAAAGRPIRVNGNGLPRRSYCYMTDLVVWLLVILTDGVALRPYNVGSPDATSIAALARRCAESAVRGGDAVVVEGTAGAGRDYVPDVARAQHELGLRIGVPLDDAIARTLRWVRGRRSIGASAGAFA